MTFSEIISKFDGWLWGLPLIVVLLVTHVYCTLRTGFVQKHTFKGIKLSVTKDDDSEGDVSQFGALTTALAATIGTGNIVGVATAIASGGPGAVFWMWITGVLGIATKYMETAMSVRYRHITPDGRMLGGAMFALESGMKSKALGILFAFLAAIAAFGIGCLTQANSIATALEQNFNISPYIAGVVVAVIVGIVIIGGVKSITRITEKLIPFMAVFYVLGCIYLMIRNGSYTGAAIVLIVKSAFSTQAATGGFVGYAVRTAVRYGFARGLFSNESGMGSAPIVAAAAKTKNPVRQSLVSMTGTFWDTVIICALSGITMVSSVLASPDVSLENGNVITFQAFALIPVLGKPIITLALVMFAYSTILGWAYYGERAAEYLCGPKIMPVYKIIFVILAYVGCVSKLDTIWNIADILNGLMVIPNVIGIFALSKVIMRDYRRYINNIDDVDTEPIPVISRASVFDKEV